MSHILTYTLFAFALVTACGHPKLNDSTDNKPIKPENELIQNENTFTKTKKTTPPQAIEKINNNEPTPTETDTPPNNEPQHKYKGYWDYKPEGPEWTRILAEKIKETNNNYSKAKNFVNKEPDDINNYAQNFNKMSTEERIQVYVSILSCLSKKESNHNPSQKYKEKFKDSSGKWVISRGLMQVSMESCKLVYKTPIENEFDLHKPEVNLDCASRILGQWINADNRISNKTTKLKKPWKGLSRYFSPFRKADRINWIRQCVQNNQTDTTGD